MNESHILFVSPRHECCHYCTAHLRTVLLPFISHIVNCPAYVVPSIGNNHNLGRRYASIRVCIYGAVRIEHDRDVTYKWHKFLSLAGRTVMRTYTSAMNFDLSFSRNNTLFNLYLEEAVRLMIVRSLSNPFRRLDAILPASLLMMTSDSAANRSQSSRRRPMATTC